MTSTDIAVSKMSVYVFKSYMILVARKHCAVNNAKKALWR